MGLLEVVNLRRTVNRLWKKVECLEETCCDKEVGDTIITEYLPLSQHKNGGTNYFISKENVIFVEIGEYFAEVFIEDTEVHINLTESGVSILSNRSLDTKHIKIVTNG